MLDNWMKGWINSACTKVLQYRQLIYVYPTDLFQIEIIHSRVLYDFWSATPIFCELVSLRDFKNLHNYIQKILGHVFFSQLMKIFKSRGYWYLVSFGNILSMKPIAVTMTTGVVFRDAWMLIKKQVKWFLVSGFFAQRSFMSKNPQK